MVQNREQICDLRGLYMETQKDKGSDLWLEWAQRREKSRHRGYFENMKNTSTFVVDQ